MDARARQPARETPTTGSIAYLYPGLPACSPQSRARRALGRVTASPRPPLPSEPRGASRVRALPASATNAARRGPRARRAVRRDVPCVPRPSTQPEPVPFESPASSLRADGVRRVAFWRLRRARLTRAQATFLKVPKNVPPDGVGKIRPSFGGPRCRRISNLLRIPRANQNRDLRKIFLKQENRSRRVFSHANEKRQQRKSLTHARLEIANENPPFPRERFRNRFSPHPTVKRPFVSLRDPVKSFRNVPRHSGRREKRGASREPRTPPGPAGPARVPGSRSARGALATARGARENARRRASRPRASLGASRPAHPSLPLGETDIFCPTGRASGAEGRGGMSTASASATEVGRVRPTEKYWTDYEDWKVRPTTREERRERRERSSKGKGVSLGGVGVRRSFFSRARRGFACVFFFFLQPSRARTERTTPTHVPEKNERS